MSKKKQINGNNFLKNKQKKRNPMYTNIDNKYYSNSPDKRKRMFIQLIGFYLKLFYIVQVFHPSL